MKKVININFQGRVIPIEESAYDILKKYIESLTKYFAQEYTYGSNLEGSYFLCHSLNP